MKKGYLVLSDGRYFEGQRIGADTDTVGELVFTTGMCGYIETLTDPSYSGQIVMQTFPLIGNYGIIKSDFEGECAISGYIVREICETPSNFRCDGTLDEFLRKKNIPGLCGIDTRELTKIIREQGVINAKICSELPKEYSDIQTYSVTGAVDSVTVKKPKIYKATGAKKYNVALLDYGAKRNIIRELCSRGCEVTLLPAKTSAKDILSCGYDGVMLSNGPGDPADNTFEITTVKDLFGQIPIFGICLGHQLLALANGAKTIKLKYGHRGVNQPVREVFGKRTYITSQNHGYAVDINSVINGRVTFINANDGTCEGIDYPGSRAFSVQFHPEAASGPHDTEFLFDKFTAFMGGAD